MRSAILIHKPPRLAGMGNRRGSGGLGRVEAEGDVAMGCVPAATPSRTFEVVLPFHGRSSASHSSAHPSSYSARPRNCVGFPLRLSPQQMIDDA